MLKKGNKMLLVIVGKSGSGKTTVAKCLSEILSLPMIESYTTRPMRKGETEGHRFVTDTEFDALKNRIAEVRYNNCRYCVTEAQLSAGGIYVVEPSGIIPARRCAKQHGLDFKVIYIDTLLNTRVQRMLDRGDSYEAVLRRVELDEDVKGPFDKIPEYDILYCTNNTQDIRNCVRKILANLTND